MLKGVLATTIVLTSTATTVSGVLVSSVAWRDYLDFANTSVGADLNLLHRDKETDFLRRWLSHMNLASALISPDGLNLDRPFRTFITEEQFGHGHVVMDCLSSCTTEFMRIVREVAQLTKISRSQYVSQSDPLRSRISSLRTDSNQHKQDHQKL